ncbi:MAG: substrate-binding domain-containing protein [Bacillota bacterium]
MKLLSANRILTVAVTLALIFLSWGCGKSPQKKPVSTPVPVAVCFADMNRDGNKIIKNVMEKRKKADGVNITWLDAKNDADTQKKQIEKLAGQNIKAAVIQFVDQKTGPDLMRKLVEKNIKVVALENLPVDFPVDAYVSSDHAMSGQLLARFAINSARQGAGLPVPPDAASGAGQGQQGGEGQQGRSSVQGRGGGGQTGVIIPPGVQTGGKLPLGVVLLSGNPSDRAMGEIAEAARTALKSSTEVTLLADEAVSDPAGVPAILQKIIGKNSVQAVLAVDSSIAMAAVKVLEDAGMNNRVLTAGVGADEKSSKALESGKHDAEVDTRPDLLGQYALDAAINLATNGRWEYDSRTETGSYSVPSRIVPVRLVQSESAYLLKQRWGQSGGAGGKGAGAGQQGGNAGKSGNGSGSGSGQKSDQESGGNGGLDQGGGGQDQGGSGGGQGRAGKGKTMLRITTQDGKTMEVQIDGKVKKIESSDGGQGQTNADTE